MSAVKSAYKVVYVTMLWSWMFISTCVAALIVSVTSMVLPRKLHCQIANQVQSAFAIIFVNSYERNSNIRVRMSGDTAKEGESAFILANHLNHDWAVLYAIAWRVNMLGNLRTMIKDVAKYVPGFGWAMNANDWIFLKRNWVADKAYLAAKMARYREDGMPLHLCMFPEGTRRTEKLMARSKTFAEDRKLKALKHCMQPRTKGFVAIAKDLDGVCDYVYDISLAYDGWAKNKGRDGPGPMQLLFPEPADKMHTIHYNLRKIPLSDLPSGEEELTEWCFELFQAKDKMMEHFEQHGHFPAPTTACRMEAKHWLPQFLIFSVLDCMFVWAIRGLWSALF